METSQQVSHWVWSIDPMFITSPVAVRWYALMFLTGFMLGNHLMFVLYRRDGLNEEPLHPLLNVMFGGAVIGARLGHCLFYEPAYFMANPMEILMFWKGGLASHGGLVGILIGIWFYVKKFPKPHYLGLLDYLSASTALGCGFIRLGNFFNSEILGDVTSLPWGIVFARIDGPMGPPRHPVQLYEALAYFLIFAWLWLRQKRVAKGHGQYFGPFLFWVFSARVLIEFTKEPQAEFSSVLPINMGAILSFPAVVAGAWLWWRSRQQVCEQN
jgi:prolipoprotein diacylglyceryl transferase